MEADNDCLYTIYYSWKDETHFTRRVFKSTEEVNNFFELFPYVIVNIFRAQGIFVERYEYGSQLISWTKEGF
jgi:hypothetical protein